MRGASDPTGSIRASYRRVVDYSKVVYTAQYCGNPTPRSKAGCIAARKTHTFRAGQSCSSTTRTPFHRAFGSLPRLKGHPTILTQTPSSKINNNAERLRYRTESTKAPSWLDESTVISKLQTLDQGDTIWLFIKQRRSEKRRSQHHANVHYCGKDQDPVSFLHSKRDETRW